MRHVAIRAHRARAGAIGVVKQAGLCEMRLAVYSGRRVVRMSGASVRSNAMRGSWRTAGVGARCGRTVLQPAAEERGAGN